jgi:hypothetical protein
MIKVLSTAIVVVMIVLFAQVYMTTEAKKETAVYKAKCDSLQNRADSLYIVTTPDINYQTGLLLSPQDVIDNLDNANLDTNYTATYYPWVKYEDDIKYLYSNINELDTKDVDYLIKNNWIDVLKKFDGYMVISSYEPNIDDTSYLKKYKFENHKVKN